MLDYTTFRIAQQEYRELARRRAAEGVCVQVGPMRLGRLLVAVWRRLRRAMGVSARTSEGTRSGDGRIGAIGR